MEKVLILIGTHSLAAIAGFVVAILYKKWYDKQAESAEKLAIKGANALDKSIQGVANTLQKPGK